MANLNAIWVKIMLVLFVQAVMAEIKESNHSEMPKSFRKQFISATNKCAAKVNVSPVNLLQVLVDEQPVSFLITEDTKCYLLCIFQEFSLMDDKGKYNENGFRDLLDSMKKCRFANVIRDNLKTCMEEYSIFPCEKAYHFAKCFYNNRNSMLKIADSAEYPKSPVKEIKNSPKEIVSGDL